MAKKSAKSIKSDRSQISSEAHEIAYWTKKWKISVQQLNGAKRAVGSASVKKIEAYLRAKGAI